MRGLQRSYLLLPSFLHTLRVCGWLQSAMRRHERHDWNWVACAFASFLSRTIPSVILQAIEFESIARIIGHLGIRMQVCAAFSSASHANNTDHKLTSWRTGTASPFSDLSTACNMFVAQTSFFFIRFLQMVAYPIVSVHREWLWDTIKRMQADSNFQGILS